MSCPWRPASAQTKSGTQLASCLQVQQSDALVYSSTDPQEQPVHVPLERRAPPLLLLLRENVDRGADVTNARALSALTTGTRQPLAAASQRPPNALIESLTGYVLPVMSTF